MKLWESPFRSLRVAAVLAGALAVLVFLNSLYNEWAFDDLHIIASHEAIHSLETLPQALLAPYWPGEYGEDLGLWRPAITAVYGLQWALWDGVPTGFHVVNVLLHAGVTVLVVLLLGQILPVAGALVGGLIFAVHAVHVEAVANVVGLAEVLAALFYLSACLLILRGGERLGPLRLLGVFVLFALGMLTKESVVTLPGVVLLLDSTRRDLRLKDLGGYLRARWPLYGGLVVIAAGILWARTAVLGSVASAFAPLGAHLLEEVPRIWTVATTWPHIVRLLFFPLELVSDYAPAVVPIALGWNAQNLVGVALVLLFLVLALVSWRQGPMSPHELAPRALGWGVVWFVITLSPTSNVVFLSGILLSERTLYLPSVGFVAAAAWGVLALTRVRPRVAVTMLLLFLGFLGGRTWTRNPTWKNNLEVFNTLLVNHPEAGRAQWLLGDALFDVGRASDGLRAYRAAVGILGGHYILLGKMSQRFMDAGYQDAAEHLLQQAWNDRPELGYAPGLLASLYLRQERFSEAGEAARASLRADSTDPVQYHILARAMKEQGRLEDAVRAREASIRHGEGEHWQQWGWLAELQVARGDTAAALRAMDSARVRASSPRAMEGVDSILVGLGLAPDSLSGEEPPGPSTPGGSSDSGPGPETGSRDRGENARDSQNPRETAPKSVTPGL